MRTSPYTAMAAAPGTQYSGLANLMAMQGSGGDNTLVHMSKSELPYLNSLARAAGHPQGLPVNPKTGLPEANILKSILPIAGTILGGMFAPQFLPAILGKGALAAGVGAGLGSFGGSLLAGKSFKDAAIGGLLSGGLSGLSAGMFGGQSLMGDTTSFVDPAAAKIAADQAAQIAASNAGTTAANVTGAQISQAGQLGAFGMPEFAGGSDLLTTAGGGTGLGTAGSAIANAQNAMSTPMFADTGGDFDLTEEVLSRPLNTFRTAAGGVTNVPPAAFRNIDARIASEAAGMASAPNQFVESAPVVPTDSITTGDIQRAYVDQGIFPKAPSLREGYTPNVKDLRAINQMSEPSYLSPIQQYNPEGPLTRMDFLKTQLKPAATQAGVMLGIDALTEQGAFEPIDYSGYPTGEENKVSPLPLRGLKFESERTGAFPTTTAQALAFAQPGGVPRQRFFNQRFTIPAKTGGGIEALINKGSEPFQTGGPTALELALSDDSGAGGFGTDTGADSTSGSSGGLSGQTAGGLIGSGLGTLGKAALGLGMFSPPGIALSVASNLIGQTIGAKQEQAQEEAEAEAAATAAAASMAGLGMDLGDMPEDTEQGNPGVPGSQASVAQGIASLTSQAMDSFVEGPGPGGGDTGSGGGGFGSGSGPGSGFGDEGFGGIGGEEGDDSGSGSGAAGDDDGGSDAADGEGGFQQGGYLGEGGLVSAFAMGGMPSPYFEGRVVGPGDGMSDSIPFSIEGQQPAILSRDEYVLPADIVSMMGNGSSDAGAGKIDSFINDFRMQKYGRGEQPPETNKGLSSIA